VITAELIKKYVALQNDQLALLRTKVDEWKKEQAKLGNDPGLPGAPPM